MTTSAARTTTPVPGAVATFGQRLGAFVIDSIAANLIVGLASLGGWHPGDQRGWLVLLAFLAIEFVSVASVGQTPGMRLLRLAVTTPGGQRPAPQWALLRTALIAVIVPALIVDGEGRAMHDRAAGTIMHRTG